VRPPSRLKIVLLWACAVLALGFLVFTYAEALRADRWPKGHPWHGLALGAMAAFFAVQTRLHQGGTGLRAVAVLLPLVAMAAMAMALAVSRGGG
jgi:hypothetical protein